MEKKNIKKIIWGIAVGFAGVSVIAKWKKADSVYDNEPGQKNPFEGKKVVFVEDADGPGNADGKRGHLEAVGDSVSEESFYGRYVKRILDVILSFVGMTVLSPLFAVIAAAIKIDDPGPVLFTQKRVGKNKRFFKLHKFRTMKMSTPHDVPTHMLKNPEQYITRVGKFLRKSSLDELPQLWDIFLSNCTIVGPRPALWSQDLLVSERDKYGANEVKPGLTGWAQINGRDELEIEEKARLDGEYVKRMGFGMDIRCFFKTIGSVLRQDGIVEGRAKGETIADPKKAFEHGPQQSFDRQSGR